MRPTRYRIQAPEALAAMGTQAQQFYAQHLALTVGVGRFGELFRQLASAPSRRLE